MAFATANVRTDYFGSLKVTAGDWTGSAGDAAGSIQVEGGRIYSANFDMQDPTNPTALKAAYSVSGTDGVITVSVFYHEDVNTGRFLIISA